MKRNATLRRALVGVAAAVTALAAQADPTPVAHPPALQAGFEVQWAADGTSPHTISAAEAILAAPTSAVTQFLSTVNVGDGGVPFPGSDPTFAVRVTGYVQLAAGDYTFKVTHDDGARLVLGGQPLIVYDSDTSPTATFSSPQTLAAGVYAISLLSWEQGGQFLLQLEASRDGAAYEFVQGLHAAPVPEPGSLALLAAGLGLVAGAARRRRG